MKFDTLTDQLVETTNDLIDSNTEPKLNYLQMVHDGKQISSKTKIHTSFYFLPHKTSIIQQKYINCKYTKYTNYKYNPTALKYSIFNKITIINTPLSNYIGGSYLMLLQTNAFKTYINAYDHFILKIFKYFNRFCEIYFIYNFLNVFKYTSITMEPETII